MYTKQTCEAFEYDGSLFLLRPSAAFPIIFSCDFVFSRELTRLPINSNSITYHRHLTLNLTYFNNSNTVNWGGVRCSVVWNCCGWYTASKMPIFGLLQCTSSGSRFSSTLRLSRRGQAARVVKMSSAYHSVLSITFEVLYSAGSRSFVYSFIARPVFWTMDQPFNNPHASPIYPGEAFSVSLIAPVTWL